MNKTLLIIVAILVICFALNRAFTKPTNNDTVTMTVEGHVYRLLVADDDAEWMQGLMNVRKLEDADGMVFLFPVKKPQMFWNQNTYVDLDIIWMDGDRVIGKSFLPSIEKSKGVVFISSPGNADKVLEIIRK